MREQKIRYADAGMDIKKLALCFAKRIWLAAAAGAAGAVIGGLVYLMVSVVPEAEREYHPRFIWILPRMRRGRSIRLTTGIRGMI